MHVRLGSDKQLKSLYFSHKYVCHHSYFNKVPSSQNKRGISKNSNCPATFTIKVKLDIKIVRKRDEYSKRGLFTVICKSEGHNHSLETSETLRFFPSYECRETFVEYFNVGMSIPESSKYHENILHMQENFTIEMLANSRINPT
ncbi:hypothetical protein AVEN_127912-1 [Araneus ventricosus]|uniref:Uncharacterized protein n=1 Tax=Araneus ventricosus TaxID=182803 RepID=A0A4Y1ZYS9_ARAVE|nr:hypothetical protein AVEN_127912-1 [Araneus ventricosus]